MCVCVVVCACVSVCVGRDLHIEESCDHLVALLLLLRPLWLTDEALDLDALVPVV